MELSESIILSALYSNEDYVRRTLPYLEKDYFTSEPNKIIFELIRVMLKITTLHQPKTL